MDAQLTEGRSLDPRLVRPVTDDFGFIGVEGTGTLERAELGGVVSAASASGSLPLGASASGGEGRLPLLDHAFSATAGLGVGLLERGSVGASVAVALPIHVLDGEDRTIPRSYRAPGGFSSESIGSPTLTLKWALRSARRSETGAALILDAAPSVAGTLNSDRGLTLWPRLALEWAPGAGNLVVNLGYRILTASGPWLVTTGSGAGLRYDDPLTLGISARVAIAGPLEAGLELHVAQIARSIGEPQALSSEVLGAVRAHAGIAHFSLAAGVGLGDGFLNADTRVMAMASFHAPQGDPDGDGIAGDADHCPKLAEDLDLVRDRDGCPEPDNDGDGMLDALDECPSDPGFGSGSGCPLRGMGDRDADFFNDYVDRCPTDPGAVHGCPSDDPRAEPAEQKHIYTPSEVEHE